MNTLTPEEMSRLDAIIQATDDQELQSELWIFLHDNPHTDVDFALASVTDYVSASDFVHNALKTMLNAQPKPHTLVFLDALAPIEKSIATMIMVGLPKDTACKYKSLSSIRYNQVVSAIVTSKAWEKYVEEEANIRRKTRARKQSNKNS